MSTWNVCPAWVAASCLALALCLGCGQANQYQPPLPAEVDVAQPVTDEVRDFLEFTGTTQATNTVDIRARVNGYLMSIHFEDGATVAKGDLLMVIEPEPFEAALASAKASLQKAEASLKLAEAELKRTEPLVKRGALPEQEQDVKEADVATATADVATAKSTVIRAELDLSYTKIVAPMSGRIGRHLVDVGNLVQSETTSLTTLESIDEIHAYFNASESDVLRLMELNRSEGKRDEIEILLGLPSEDGFPHHGVLDFSEFGVDRSTGTQMRRGVFKNEDGKLVPGLFVRIRLPIGTAAKELLVSERAIAADQRGEYLLVVNNKNEVEYRPSELGISVNGMRVIKSGVKEGEWVVINGLQRARPKSVVVPVQHTMAGEPLQPAVEQPAAQVTAAAATTTRDGG